MDIEIKNLKAPDLFIVTTIMSKLGLREIANHFKEAQKTSSKKDQVEIDEAVGIAIAGTVLANLQNCEKEIYQVLSNVTGLKTKEIQELDATDFIDLIIKVIMNPNNKDFFKHASRFLNIKM